MEGRASARSGQAEARPSGNAGDTPTTTVNRLALHKLSDEIF